MTYSGTSHALFHSFILLVSYRPGVEPRSFEEKASFTGFTRNPGVQGSGFGA